MSVRDTPSIESQCTTDMVKDANSPRISGNKDTHSRSTTHKPADDSYWPRIATRDEIPGWLRDNDYIIRGHPMPTFSYKKSFRLWRCLHMETMNIWTHFLGSIKSYNRGCYSANTKYYTLVTDTVVCWLHPPLRPGDAGRWPGSALPLPLHVVLRSPICTTSMLRPLLSTLVCHDY